MMAHEMLSITGNIFGKIESFKEFEKFVVDQFRRHAQKAAFAPQFSGSLMKEAHHCYMEDIDRMAKAPDYFDRCGCLAYWLRRNNPVMEWESTKKDYDLTAEEENEREFFFNFGRQYHAFYLGYTICLTLDREKLADKSLPYIDENYIRAACHLMKYKNISPHAMGFIYRSLFFV